MSLRSHVVTLTASVLLATGVGFVSPAQAATFVPPADLQQTAATSTTASFSWAAVPKAPRYRIQLSRSSAMTSSTYYRFTGTSGKVSGLKAATRYYARVRVITQDGGNLSDYTTTPVSGWTSFVTPERASAVGAGPSSLAVTWKSVTGAPNYRVELTKVGSSADPTYHRFATSPGSITGLEAGAGYTARVRVITPDGLNLSSYASSSAVARTSTSATPGPTGLSSTGASRTMLRVDWSDVAGAQQYQLESSRSSSMSSPTSTKTTTSSAELGGLTAGTTYYLRVRVLDAAGAATSDWSPVAGAATAASSAEFTHLVPEGLASTDAGPTSASFSWRAVVGAPGYRLQVATTESMAGATYVRSTPTAATVSGLKPVSTYFVKVRVIDADGNNLSAYSGAVQVKTSAADDPLDIASFNIKCQSCLTAGSSRPAAELPWTERRDAVVATVVSRRPDVIGVQEASQGWIKEGGKTKDLSQFEDLRNRLRAQGAPYELANRNRNNCVKSTTPTNCSAKDQGASKGTKIYYDTDTVTLLKQGSKRLDGCSGCNERYVAWATFRQESTGKSFFFATTHLEPGGEYYSLRVKQMRTALAEIEAKNIDDLPRMLVGDFNLTMYSDDELSTTAYDVAVASGLVDPLGHLTRSAKVGPKATAETRVNAHYNSYNDFAPNQKRYAPTENGSNIDHVLTSPMRVLRWETVVNTDVLGNLTGIIPSDHNMLNVRVKLP